MNETELKSLNVTSLASPANCRHYWLIEEANGPTSSGVCKYCGGKKEFYNAFQSKDIKFGEGAKPIGPSKGATK